MHCSKLDIRSADAGAGGMAISAGSGDAGMSGMGASSSSSDASAMANSTRSSGAGSGVMCFANNAQTACSNGLAEFGVGVGAQATPTSRPRLVFVADVRDYASCPVGRRLSSPCSVHDHVVERAVEDGAGQRHIWMQLLKLRKTAGSHGCK